MEERETHELYVEPREKLKRVRESERLYKVALVLSWLFFIFVMLFLCLASVNNNVRMRNLNLLWGFGGRGVLKCDWVIEMLLYLSPEMKSVVFVQIFFSIYFFFTSFYDWYILAQSVMWNVNNMNGTSFGFVNSPFTLCWKDCAII